MRWLDPQKIFYIVGSLFSLCSMLTIYIAVRQYRRTLRHRTAESLLELEKRFGELEDILPLIDPETGRASELEPTLRKSLDKLPQEKRSNEDRKLILRLDRFLRFMLLLTALVKYELLRPEALAYEYWYWFDAIKRNRLLKSYVQINFPTLAYALDDETLFSTPGSPRRFLKETVISAQPEIVFDFHLLPDALTRLTPAWAGTRVIEAGDISKPGSEATLEVKLFRIFPLRWVAKHTVYARPFLFEDVQKSGPFKSWRHRHMIERHEDGATLRDEIIYELPFGFIGRGLAGGMVARRLQKVFDYRHEVTRKWCEGKESK